MLLRNRAFSPAIPHQPPNTSPPEQSDWFNKARAIRHGNQKRSRPHGDFSPDRENHQPRERPERDCGGGLSFSGEQLRDEQANEQKFYQTRAERIEFTAIMRRRTRRNGRRIAISFGTTRSGRRSGKTRSWRGKSKFPCRMN